MKCHGRGGSWFCRVSGRKPAERPMASLIPPALVSGETHVELVLPEQMSSVAAVMGVSVGVRPSRGRDTGPAHRVSPNSGCAGFARPVTWVPDWYTASR